MFLLINRILNENVFKSISSTIMFKKKHDFLNFLIEQG